MVASDVIRFAGEMSILLGLMLTTCSFLLPNKKGLMALSMVLAGAILILGGVLPDQSGRPFSQVYMIRILNAQRCC